MKAALFVLLALSSAVFAVGEEFVPPAAHPLDRYEAGWQKNPFTLKTAPVAIQKESFAKDLALANWRGAGEDTIVSVVNVKTREYTRLKNSEAAPNGMRVKIAHLADKRDDSFVELELGGETAVVKYDETFLKQMAAKVGAVPGPPGAPQIAGQTGTAQRLPSPGAPVPAPAAPGANIVRPPAPGANNSGANNPQRPVLPNTSVPTPQRRRINNLPIPGSGQR